MGYYTPPSSGGGGSSFPSVVAAVNHLAQTDSLSFNLLDNPATGDYVLNDYVNFGTLDATVSFEYEVFWDDGTSSGQIDLGYGNSNGNPFPISIQGLLLINTVGGIRTLTTPPMVIHAVTGTPIAVIITLTPGGVATVAVSAGSAGLLYAPGDTGTLQGASNTAVYQVLTVGAGGAVETVAITFPGNSYQIEDGVGTTVTSGSGDGNLELDILTLVASAMQFDYHATLVRNQ